MTEKKAPTKKVTKEVTAKEAAEKAAKANEHACKEGIFVEAHKLAHGKTHSVQQLIAYARQLEKMGKMPGVKPQGK